MPLARYQSMAQDDAGNVLASPTVEVRRESDNGLASLFSDRAGTAGLANPFTAGVDGLIAFHVIGGAYKVTVTKASDVRTFRYVGIGTNSEYDFDPAGGGAPPSNTPPLMDGTAAAGAAALYSRGDHIHPSDTSRAAATHTHAESDITNLTTDLAAKAPLASPALTGTPTSATAPPADDATTKIPNTAWVQTEIGQATVPPATVAPLMDGAAAVGTVAKYAKEDHVHPSDTSRQAADADLTQVAALSGTGIARRTAVTPTWSVGGAVTNAELATMPAFTFKGNNSGGAAVPGDIDIAALTAKVSPGGGDFLIVSDQAASGAWKKVAISNMPGSAGGIPEAPNDGLQYGRQSLGWTQITGGGGASPSNALPLVNGTAAAGSSALYSRGDHIHPTDTSRQAADAELAAIAGLVSAVDTLPYFTGSGTAALAAFSAFARTLVDDADAATARTTLGLTSAATATPAALSRTNDTNVTLTLGGTPLTALLQATSITVGWSGTLAPGRGGFGADISAAAGVPIFTAGVATFTPTTGTGNIARDSTIPVAATVAPLGDGTAAVGVATKYAREDHVHPLDAELAAIAGLTSAADRLPYFTGLGTAALATFTTFGRSLVDDADAATARATIGAIPEAPTDGQSYVRKGQDASWQVATGGGVPATVAPLMDGTAAVGVATKYAREDHVHPTNTSRDATTAQYWNNTAGKVLTTDQVWAAAAPVTISDSTGTITPTFGAGLDFVCTMTGTARTLAAPSNIKIGQKGVMYFVQDGAGSKTLTVYNAVWKFPGGTKPTLSTVANSIDAIGYAVKSSTEIICNFVAGYA